MKFLVTLTLSLLMSSAVFAAPKCLDLPRATADKAVKLMRIALNNGSPLILLSKHETGLVKPLGVWTEVKKSTGKNRIRIDGREVDISLIYIAHSPTESRAWNVAWMSGCRPAINKPTYISNNY